MLLIGCVVVYTALAALLDWRTKRLPNWMTVSAFGMALVFHITTGGLSGGVSGACSSLLFSLGGFATGFGILFVLWAIGGGGGGDVKFMGALGAWLGAAMTVQVFLLGAVLVLIGSLAMLGWEFARLGMGRAKDRYLGPRQGSDERQRVRRRLLPFGVPAMVATWLVLAASFLK
jgi:prepilin peptidase CpaA